MSARFQTGVPGIPKEVKPIKHPNGSHLSWAICQRMAGPT